MIERDYRLDILKSVSITLVLAWHLQPWFTKGSNFSNWFAQTIIFIYHDIFLYQISLTAVPVFFLVSLYLLFLKKREYQFDYIVYRLKKLLSIYLFWSLFQLIIYLLTTNTIGQSEYKLSTSLPSFIRLVIHGGPPLPIVGGSVFYFLFNLIIVTVLAYFIDKINKTNSLLGLIIIFTSLIYFETVYLQNNQIPYYRIDNFIIYIPLAYFIYKAPSFFINNRVYFFAGFILFSIHDIFLRNLGFNSGGTYSRVSIVLGAISLFSIIFSCQDLKANTVIVNFLANYSLGIFALHKYWQLLFTLSLSSLFKIIKIPETYILPFFTLQTLHFFVSFFTIILTCICVKIISISDLKRFVK